MTCDECFDYLTSAVPLMAHEPPSAHLDACPRCRSLAEALEPALELFRSAAGEVRAERAPGNPGDEIPEWLLAEMDAADLNPATKALPMASHDSPALRSAKSRRSLVWPALAATLIGLLAGGAVWGVSAASQRGTTHQPDNAWPALAAIQLSPACMAPRDSFAPLPPANSYLLGAMVQADRDRLNCCTSCHALGRVAAAACDARLLAVSCQACHSR